MGDNIDHDDDDDDSYHSWCLFLLQYYEWQLHSW